MHIRIAEPGRYTYGCDNSNAVKIHAILLLDCLIYISSELETPGLCPANILNLAIVVFHLHVGLCYVCMLLYFLGPFGVHFFIFSFSFTHF